MFPFVRCTHLRAVQCWELTSGLLYCKAFVSNGGTVVSGGVFGLLLCDRTLDNAYLTVNVPSGKVVYLPFLHASKDGCASCLWTSTLLKVENKSGSLFCLAS